MKHKRIIDVHVASKIYPQHGHGLGDAVLMIPIFKGVADANPDALVRAVVKEKNVPWVQLGYENTITYESILANKQSFQNEVWPQLWESPGGDIHAINAGLTRQQLWARDAGIELKPVTPKIPAAARAWAADIHKRYLKDKPFIFISPWACAVERTWPIRYWAELVDGLLCYGHQIAGVRQKGGEFLDGVMWHDATTFPADRTAALFERCSLVIGNDSGMVHVAGFVGAPGLAVCAPTDGKTIFGSYPTVKWIQSPYFCSACNGLTREYNPRWCRLGCNAMTALQPKAVIEAALTSLLQKPLPLVYRK